MKRFLIFVAGILAALTIAACGTAAIGGSGSGGTVGTKQIDGFGNVLVDSSGMALYVNDQESGGKMLCDGSCTSIWQPLTVAKASAAKASGVDGLGVVSRSDGSKQVTLDGKPLYTFYLDRPGKVTGDDFADSFGSQKFLWHVALQGDAAASSGGGSSGGGSSGSGQSGGGGSLRY